MPMAMAYRRIWHARLKVSAALPNGESPTLSSIWARWQNKVSVDQSLIFKPIIGLPWQPVAAIKMLWQKLEKSVRA